MICMNIFVVDHIISQLIDGPKGIFPIGYLIFDALEDCDWNIHVFERVQFSFSNASRSVFKVVLIREYLESVFVPVLSKVLELLQRNTGREMMHRNLPREVIIKHRMIREHTKVSDKIAKLWHKFDQCFTDCDPMIIHGEQLVNTERLAAVRDLVVPFCHP